jgi:hypothetical protein
VVLRIVYRLQADEKKLKEQLFYYRCDLEKRKYEPGLFHASISERDAITKRLHELKLPLASQV